MELKQIQSKLLKSELLPVYILTLGLMVRIGYAVFGVPMYTKIFSDMRAYEDIAIRITEGRWGEFSFFQSVGYPLVIAGLKNIFERYLFSLTIIQSIASFISLLIMYRLVRTTYGKKIALISLIVGAFHVPWIVISNYALTETLFGFFLAICAWQSYQIVKDEDPKTLNCFLWGAAFGIGLWFKGHHALWGPLFLLGLVSLKKYKSVRPVLIISLTVALFISIHAYLSYIKTGVVKLTSSTSGLNLVEGKCPYKKNRDSAGAGWHSPLYVQIGQNKFKQWDKPFTDSIYFLKQGVQCIKDDPLVLIQSFESIPYLFYGNHAWPINQYRWVRLYELYFTVFLIVGISFYIIYFIRIKDSKENFVIYVLPFLALFLCVYIFKSEARVRLPFDIWFIPVASIGWFRIFEVTSKKSSS